MLFVLFCINSPLLPDDLTGRMSVTVGIGKRFQYIHNQNVKKCKHEKLHKFQFLYRIWHVELGGSNKILNQQTITLKLVKLEFTTCRAYMFDLTKQY